MYPSDFNVKEDYCGNNPQYFKLKQTCTESNMNRLLDQRSQYDQLAVPNYNKLAQSTLTFPALDVNQSPELSPYNSMAC